MLKGWKHAVHCAKCHKIFFIDEGSKSLDLALQMEENKKTPCCNASYEYIGLQPEKEHILNTEILDEPELEVPSIEIKETHKEYKNHSVDIIEPVPIKPAIQEEPIIKSNMKIDDIININRRMSGRYMTDVVRGVLEENNDLTKEKLNILKSEYPTFFHDALKYVPKFLKSKYNLE